jgi:hypothetical protein
MKKIYESRRNRKRNEIKKIYESRRNRKEINKTRYMNAEETERGKKLYISKRNILKDTDTFIIRRNRKREKDVCRYTRKINRKRKKRKEKKIYIYKPWRFQLCFYQGISIFRFECSNCL